MFNYMTGYKTCEGKYHYCFYNFFFPFLYGICGYTQYIERLNYVRPLIFSNLNIPGYIMTCFYLFVTILALKLELFSLVARCYKIYYGLNACVPPKSIC